MKLKFSKWLTINCCLPLSSKIFSNLCYEKIRIPSVVYLPFMTLFMYNLLSSFIIRINLYIEINIKV